MKIGMLTNPVEDILKEIERAHKLGFNLVEIGIEPPRGDPELLMAKKGSILQAIKKHRLSVVGHTAWWCDLGSPIEELRRVWIEEAKNYVDTANALGIKLLNFHAYHIGTFMKVSEFRQQVLAGFVDSLEELMGYAKPFGIRLMLENDPGKMKFKDFRYIIDQLPGLGVHLDVGHAFINGGMKEISKFINTFKDNVVHVHMHDNNGKEDEHIAIGKGNIDYGKVVRQLKKTGYDKAITLEVFHGGDKALVSSRKMIEKMWKKK